MGGAPVTGLTLPGQTTALALALGVARQIRREWVGSSLHRTMIAKPRATGFAIAPMDLRPVDAESGRKMLAGDFVFAGSALQVGPKGDPWDRPSPTRRFAQHLHRFAWVGDLLAAGGEAPAEGLRLTLDWRRVFGRWNRFSWDPDILDRRVFNLACAGKAICEGASEAETALVAQDLARQARYLLATIDDPARAAERSAAAALAGAALSGDAGEKLAAAALARLGRALPQTVTADGGHASRSPEAALELLYDLQTLDAALVERGIAAPGEMMRAIDRLSGAVWFFTLADGGIPAFQGGEEKRRRYVASARAAEDVADRQVPASRNGYQRLDGKTLQVIADAAPPAKGPWSVTACAQPMAIEVLAGGKRLISNCGWSPDAAGPQALRLVDAASTASLGDQPCGEPLRGFRASALGPRLVGGYTHVEAKRQTAEGALWLELAHDGWLKRFGLRHRRRLFLDVATDELRGEDRFSPLTTNSPQGDKTRRFTPFTVVFHLHPTVRASIARDKKSVLLRAEGDEAGWWLRNDAVEVAIETSVHFQDGQPRRAQQIVLRGQARLDVGARVRWKLAQADAWPPPR